jgi:hypothetical protein
MRVLPVICVATLTLACGTAHAQPNRIDTLRTPPAAGVNAFWTDQKMRDAKAMPMPVVQGASSGASGGTAEPKAGASRSAPSKAVPNSVARVAAASAPRPPTFWFGRLFFNVPDGALMTCVAQLASPGILVTAAHCLRDDTGKWFTNFVYVFQYQRGAGRRLTTECLATFNGFVTKENSRWAYDFGMVKLRNGGTTEGNFGWDQGWWGKHETATTIRTNGDVTNGSLVKGWSDKIVGLKQEDAVDGASGSGWIAGYESSGANPQANRLISISSHQVGDDRSVTYGPYWDESFGQLLDNAKRGCP